MSKLKCMCKKDNVLDKFCNADWRHNFLWCFRVMMMSEFNWAIHMTHLMVDNKIKLRNRRICRLRRSIISNIKVSWALSNFSENWKTFISKYHIIIPGKRLKFSCRRWRCLITLEDADKEMRRGWWAWRELRVAAEIFRSPLIAISDSLRFHRQCAEVWPPIPMVVL